MLSRHKKLINVKNHHKGIVHHSKNQIFVTATKFIAVNLTGVFSVAIL